MLSNLYMNLNKIQDRTILPSASLLAAMTQMDKAHVKNLFVMDGERFLSLLTIGDIQRAIIKGYPITDPVQGIFNPNKIYASVGESQESIKGKMQRLRAECMPVVGEDGSLVDVVFWKDITEKEQEPAREKIDLPVVIMAGGLGTRLRPITNVIPKPLVPIGEKTILEEIMDQFMGIGCRKFYLSVNYKYDLIKYYIDNLPDHYDISYFKEDKPLGTIGSVSHLKGSIDTPFFVSNCDIVIDQDYRDVYDYHRSNHNDITIVTAVKSIRIPYGVIETGEDGLMTALREKPEQTYMINTGVYILNPDLIDEIPFGEKYHITDLMEKVHGRGGRVGCFPVSENSWKDLGEWPEYLKMIKVW